jgi:hypothetical protein
MALETVAAQTLAMVSSTAPSHFDLLAANRIKKNEAVQIAAAMDHSTILSDRGMGASPGYRLRSGILMSAQVPGQKRQIPANAATTRRKLRSILPPVSLPQIQKELFEEGIEVVGVVYKQSVTRAIENL